MIEIVNGNKKYGTEENPVFALNNINLSINRGEICVIIGQSGSGKSTLLNVVGGLDRLDNGSIIINGNEISKYNNDQLTKFRRDNIGFVFQFYNLIQDLTVKENIEIVSDISKESLDIDTVLNNLEIKHLESRYPKELSGGQQQRVSIARALIRNPHVLLCDELTGALDSVSSKEVLRFVVKMNSLYETTTLIVTHNESICDIGDRIIKIQDGRIIVNQLNDSKKSVDVISM